MQFKTKINKTNIHLLFKPIKKSFFKKSNILNRNRNYNFYEVLGIERNSTNEQIKQAYIQLARQYHADFNKDPGAEDRYKNLTLAYDALSNERNRDLYDAYMENDPYMNDWNFWKEEELGNEGDPTGRKTHRNQGPFGSGQDGGGDFGRSFSGAGGKGFESDYDNVFNAGYRETKPQKGDDIFVIIN